MKRKKENQAKPKKNFFSRIILSAIKRKEKAAKPSLSEKEIASGENISKNKETPIVSEVFKAKFSTPAAITEREPIKKEIPKGLPSQYGQDKIVVQTRDPWWIHAYWEITAQTIEGLKTKLDDSYNSAKVILRVYDVSYINFDGTNANRYFDIGINIDASNWYINVGAPGRWWCVDLGLLLADGRFVVIVRSNVCSTPLDGPSWITDEEWMIPDDMFGRLYGLGIGLGKSSPRKGWQERLKREISSGAVSSLASPVKPKQQKKFWLAANTELIVYGATEPDAKLTIQGQPIHLRSDGTFSLRFALPDGEQIIPVRATSSDGTDQRAITPIVNKKTK